MSLDLYERETAERFSTMAPVQNPEPAMFDGFLRGTGMGIVRNIAIPMAKTTALISSIGAMAYDNNTIPRGTIADGPTALERHFKGWDEIIESATNYWTPKPSEVGVAGQLTGDVLGMLGGILAAPMAAPVTTFGSVAMDLSNKGVGDRRAQEVAAIQAAGLATGIWMPILGQNLWQRVLVGGAGYNVLQGLVVRGASGEVLEGLPVADEFKALDLTGMTLDVVLGMGFGAGIHYIPALRDARAQGKDAWEKIDAWARGLTPEQLDAIVVLREAQHLNVDSTPGTPATPADLDAHVERVRAAMEQMQRGEPVRVEDIGRPAGAEDPARTIPPAFEPAPERLQEMQARVEELVTEAETLRVAENLPHPDPAMQEAPAARPLVPEDLAGRPVPAQATAIGDAVAARLRDLGLPAEEATANGAIWRAFFRTAAEKYGVEPGDLMRRYGMDITRMELAREGAMTQGRDAWADAPREEVGYIKDSAYRTKLYEPYVKDGTVVANSREVPNDLDFPPVGSWRIAEIEGIYGREIEKLVEIPVDKLMLGELDSKGRLDPTKAGDDARYAQWLQEGRRPPPIEVVQTEGGKLSVTDGHRRALAAKLAGRKTVEAWVNFAVPIPSGQGPAGGKPGQRIRTGLTIEMLTGKVKNPYVDERMYWQRQETPAPRPPVLMRRNQHGHPELVAPDIALTKTARWETRDGIDYNEHVIVDPATAKATGRVTLGWAGDKVRQLLFINTIEPERGRGLAESVVRAILEHNGPGEQLYIGHVLRDARAFWEKLGTTFHETEAGEDGTLSIEAYRTARPDQAGAGALERTPAEGEQGRGAPAEGPAGAAGELTPRTLYQGAARRPTFYSELLRQVESLPAERVPAEGLPAAEWKALLVEPESKRTVAIRDAQNRPTKQTKEVVSPARALLPGVKAAELEQTNIIEWLDAQGAEDSARITKEQVQAFLKEGRVEVEDVMLGGKGEPTLGDATIADDVRILRESGFTPEVNPENASDVAFMDQKSQDIISAEDIGQYAQNARDDADKPNMLPETQQELAEEATRLAAAHDAAQRVENHWYGRTTDTEDGVAMEVYGRPYAELDAATRAAVDTELDARQIAQDRSPAGTHFGQYVLPGAIEGTYRELFVTMPDYGKNAALKLQPDKSLWASEQQELHLESALSSFPNRPTQATVWTARINDADYKIIENPNRVGSDRAFVLSGGKGYALQNSGARTLEEAMLRAQYHTTHPDIMIVGAAAKALGDGLETRAASWTDGHSPYDAVKNPIVRLRMNERLNEKGERGLFIEEVQQPTKAQREKMPPWAQDTKFYVPVAIKRAIMYAAEHDLKWVAWTTGEQQVDRYTGALRKAVDAIEWKKTPEGVQLIGYKGRDVGISARENELLRRDANGELTATQKRELQILKRERAGMSRNKVVDTTEKEDVLSDAIGKAMAEQIIKDPNQAGTIEGENIRIDKTWPAMLYGKTIPKATAAVLKKLGGGKITETAIETGEKADKVGYSTAAADAPRLGEMSKIDEDTFGGVDNFADGSRALYGEATLRIEGEPLPVAVMADVSGIHIIGENAAGTFEVLIPRGSLPDDWTAGTARAVIQNMWSDTISGRNRWEHAMVTVGEIFKPAQSKQQSFDITPAMRAKALEGQPLFQPAKGQIQFAGGRTIIDLFKNADASTFQHESAHLFLEILKDLSARQGAPEVGVQHWGAIAKWLKIEGGDITREQHEQFARTWEAYLRDGRAPSEELRSVFKQFRDWLLEIYHSLAELRVEMNDDIRALLDQMLVSQKADPSTTRPEGPQAQRSASSEPPPPPGEGGAAAESGRPTATAVPREASMTAAALRDATKKGPFNLRRREATEELARREAAGEQAFNRDPHEMTDKQLAKVLAGDTYSEKLKAGALLETDRRAERTAQMDAIMQDPAMRQDLEQLASEAGWAQIGGKYDAARAKQAGAAGDTGVVAFTEWIPRAEWWVNRPEGATEAHTKEAVRKALAGEKLGAAEKRIMGFLIDVAHDQHAEYEVIPEPEARAIEEDWATIEPTAKVTHADVVDADLTAKAAAIDEAAVERAAQAYESDTAGFLAAMRSIIDGHEHAQAQAAAATRAANQPQAGAGPAAEQAGAAPGAQAAAAEPGEPAGTRQQADPVALEAERFVAEHPEQLLRVGTNPDGSPIVMTAKEYLDDARAASAAAREDMSLFEIAAACLLGKR